MPLGSRRDLQPAGRVDDAVSEPHRVDSAASWVSRVVGWMETHRPPGPFDPRMWRSPLRGPWLTSVLGLTLLLTLPLVILTGLLSYAAYNPQLGGNDQTPEHGILGFYFFSWPSSPSWLYHLNQGVHVELGLVLIPVVLAKLWSVLPRLFSWPPVQSAAHLLERLSLLLLVGSILFEIATGVVNIQYWYSAFGFSFYTAHLYGAWVFIGAFIVHSCFKLPAMVRGLRSRSLRSELRTGVAETVAEPADEAGLVAVQPAAATISRRGLLGTVAGASLAILTLSIGQTLGGPLRSLALLSPHGRDYGNGPNDFQINTTAAAAAIDPALTGDAWRLEVRGASTLSLSRDALLALPQHTQDLPIACVEGWSTTQAWTGVRLVDLAGLVGAGQADSVIVESLQRGGAFRIATLSGDQLRDPSSLLALKVNGVDLSADHGFPARTIIPGAPGVHCTKWVGRLTFAMA
jgi:DMSO/TMAO reductase YedYZ molybdopterin-dependent catalytic subunit